jgi:hypothetical protein
VRVVIAGSRDIVDLNEVEKAIADSGFDISEVVCGCARGVDELGLTWGTNNDVPVRRMPADWRHGKGAGYNRNIEMARCSDALIAVWDGRSSGTAHMVRVARAQGLKVYVRLVETNQKERI